mgnify:CR=1 FL=1
MAEKKERIFKIKEQVRNIYNASKSFVILKASKKYKLMNKQLKERIMLSITEVNGCSLCSYVHTRAALSSGMTRENINPFNLTNTEHCRAMTQNFNTLTHR